MDTLPTVPVENAEHVKSNVSASVSGLPTLENKKNSKKLFIIISIAILITITCAGAVLKYSRENIEKAISDKVNPNSTPTQTSEQRYTNVVTRADMTFKFPVGALDSYKGNIELWPGRHGYDFSQEYRFVMDALLILGEIRQPIDFEFAKPIEISANYSENGRLDSHLDENKLTFLYKQDSGIATNSSWLKLPTQIDKQHSIASTTGMHTGNYVLVAPLLCPEDTSEFDDDYASSQTIGEVDAIYYDGPGNAPRTKGAPLGQKISRIFDIKQDEEWFNFEAHSGKTYILETTNLAQGVKPLIIIYDTDGVTQIASNPARLEWTPQNKFFQTKNARTFFINLTTQLDSIVGCEAKLNFTLTEK